MTDLKYCKDCKHSRLDIWGRILEIIFPKFLSGVICKRRSNRRQETLCTNERMNYEDWVDTCGPDAKYYEARK